MENKTDLEALQKGSTREQRERKEGRVFMCVSEFFCYTDVVVRYRKKRSNIVLLETLFANTKTKYDSIAVHSLELDRQKERMP